MKNKLLFLIATIIFLFSACSENPPSKEAIMESETEYPIKWVTISCAGDCTLGTDESFFGQTFPKEVEQNSKDYSVFFTVLGEFHRFTSVERDSFFYFCRHWKSDVG